MTYKFKNKIPTDEIAFWTKQLLKKPIRILQISHIADRLQAILTTLGRKDFPGDKDLPYYQIAGSRALERKFFLKIGTEMLESMSRTPSCNKLLGHSQ